MSQTLLKFSHLVSGYGDTMVLRDVSGSVVRGEVLGVLGRNGVGKTTLMKTLSGYIKPQEGAVVLNDRDVRLLAPQDRLRAGMAYAPQENVVFGELTVQENLWLHLDDKDESRYANCLKSFPRLVERMGQRSGLLSGGERKLLSFTRSIGLRAALTILDEPTEGVQPENINRMASLVRTRCEEGGAFVIVEQNLEFLLSVASTVLVMDHGQVMLNSPVEKISREQLEDYLMV